MCRLYTVTTIHDPPLQLPPHPLTPIPVVLAHRAPSPLPPPLKNRPGPCGCRATPASPWRGQAPMGGAGSSTSVPQASLRWAGCVQRERARCGQPQPARPGSARRPAPPRAGGQRRAFAGLPRRWARRFQSARQSTSHGVSAAHLSIEWIVAPAPWTRGPWWLPSSPPAPPRRPMGRPFHGPDITAKVMNLKRVCRGQCAQLHPLTRPAKPRTVSAPAPRDRALTYDGCVGWLGGAPVKATALRPRLQAHPAKLWT